jgi:ankyrin repeat protein
MEAPLRKPLSPAFRMAVLAGAAESVLLHLRSGSDVNAADEKGRTPLILAASKGRLDICKSLLERGADPAMRDDEGRTALTIAQDRGLADVIALLIPASDANAVHQGLISGAAPDPMVIGEFATATQSSCNTPTLPSLEELGLTTFRRELQFGGTHVDRTGPDATVEDRSGEDTIADLPLRADGAETLDLSAWA